MEILNLEGCTSFNNLDSIFGVLHDIKFLWKLCLTKFLRKINFSEIGIKELPSNIGSLTYLEMLNLSGCSKFKKFPDIFANLGHLRELDLSNSGIKELPSSIGSLTSLEILDFTECSKFEKFPDIFANLGHLRNLYLDWRVLKNSQVALDIWNPLKLLASHFVQTLRIFQRSQGLI